MGQDFKNTAKIFGILFGVFLFGVIFGIFLADIGYIPVREKHQSEVLGERGEISVDLTIDYGNGDIQSFPREKLPAGSTVLDLLRGLQEKGILVETRNFPGLGVFIEAIHGVSNTNSSYWQFWVNGEYSQVGAEQYVLKDGDGVLWKRTSERFKE